MTTSYDAIIIGSGAVRTEVLPQDMKATSGWITESTLVDFNELRQGFAKHPVGQPAESQRTKNKRESNYDLLATPLSHHLVNTGPSTHSHIKP